MSNRIYTRKQWKQRITAVVWAGILAGTGVLTIYALSGNSVDLELAAIIAFAALGAWLLFSALVTSSPRGASTVYPVAGADSADAPATPTR